MTDFALGLFPTTLQQTGSRAALAEKAGFDAVWVGDIQSTHPELYTSLASIALSTRSVQFGPGVTNPVTRDPVVAAAALATLAEASSGRAFLGIGTGDSALHNVGLAPARLAELEAYVTAMRSLWSTGHAVFRGRDLLLGWWKDRLPIPVLLAGHGPKTLELAGRVADGVIVGTGFVEGQDPAQAAIDRGAGEVGREPAAIKRWRFCMVNIADDDETAIDQLATPLSALANLLIRNGPAGKGVPPHLVPAFEELERRYDFGRHAEASTTGSNASLVRELGLLDYLAERFAVAGTPASVARRISDLADRGFDSLWFTRTTDDTELFLARWAGEVRPLLDSTGQSGR